MEVRRLGLTDVDVELLLHAQRGVCAICGKRFRPGRPPQRDHDHRTGAVRGLLCVYCNRTLGTLHEDRAWLRSAVDYLDNGQAHVKAALGRTVYVPDSPGAAGLIQEAP